MKKRIISALLVLVMASSLIISCGKKEEAANDVAKDATPEATAQVEEVVEEKEVEEVVEEVEEVPETVEVEYNLSSEIANAGKKDLFTFHEGLAWIVYEDDDYESVYGVIDTEGNLICSIDQEGLFNGKSIEGITPFNKGLSVLYTEDNGLAVVNSAGEIILSDINEDTYFTGYSDEGEIFYTVHSTGFSDDDWILKIVKSDGSVEEKKLTKDDNEHWEYLVSVHRGSDQMGKMIKLDDGLYIKDAALIDVKEGKAAFINSELECVQSEKVMFLNGGEALKAELKFDKSERELYDYAWGCFDKKNKVAGEYIGNGYVYVQLVDDYQYVIKDLDNNIIVSIPKDITSRSVRYKVYDGEFLYLEATGNDDCRYVIKLDADGNMAYDPVNLGGRNSRYFDVIKGYVITGNDGELKVVSPEGEFVDNNDLSCLGADAYLNLSARNGVVEMPKISEGFIYYPNDGKIVSLDGKTEITSVKAEIPYDEYVAKNESSSSSDDYYEEEEYDDYVDMSKVIGDYIGEYISSDKKIRLYLNETDCYLNIGDTTFENSGEYAYLESAEEVRIIFNDYSEASLRYITDDKCILEISTDNPAVNSGSTYKMYVRS